MAVALLNALSLGGAAARVVRVVDVPGQPPERRLVLHLLAAAHRLLDQLELHEAHRLLVAVLARARGDVALVSAEVALERVVGQIVRQLGEEEAG